MKHFPPRRRISHEAVSPRDPMPATALPRLASPLLPWNDRAGRFSALRAVVFALVCLPALVLLGRALGDDLGPRPWVEAIHVSGDWAMRFLLASIVVTPLRALSGQSKLIGVRRMIGLAALAWAGLHFGLYVVDKGGAIGVVASEILLRPYLTIGFVALVGLVALGVTSRDAAIRRMGGAAWKRLHGLVHPIVVLAIVHTFLQSKLDLAQGTILAGIAFGGLAARVALERGASIRLTAAVAVVTAFAGAVAAEAVWFALKTGRSPAMLVASFFDVDAPIAPVWVAAAITLAGAAVALAERTRRDRANRRPAAARA